MGHNYAIEILDKEEPVYSSSLLASNKPINMKRSYPFKNGVYLWHGIPEQPFEKLAFILQNNAILSRRNIDLVNGTATYSNKPDGSNGPDYISLAISSGAKNKKLDYFGDSTFNTWILPNISLIIDPKCDALRTIQIPPEVMESIKSYNGLKNRYSTISNEWQIKDKILLSYVLAIGVPHKHCANHGESLERVTNLLTQYSKEIPIVDTSDGNKVLRR